MKIKYAKKIIVITTINSPTTSVRRFSELNGYKLLVIGDERTPNDWHLDNVRFIPIDEQHKLGFKISKSLPRNHYSRKNIGYLYAAHLGADIIVDTDDDNIPKEDWEILSFQGMHATSSDNLGFVNLYKSFTENHIWPRGFPLDQVTSESSILKEEQLLQKSINIGVWQGLADGDPDVDAIYRLILNTPCAFKDKDPIILGKGTLCPFNSQNTTFQKKLFPLLYLPCFVSFRYTDILRGLVAQPIMWALNYRLGFTKATVVQERNPHNYMEDFESEIPCYLNPYKVIEAVSSSICVSNSVSENLYQAYTALHHASIVSKEEVELVSDWLLDIDSLGC
jgi:hypothetical protein